MSIEKNDAPEMDVFDMAETQQEENRILTFRLEKQFYGVSITHVEQILSMQPLTAMPEFPPYAKGVINLRGNIVPVIDLRLRIGLAETPYTERTCIVIINFDSFKLGCIVDEVDAVVDVPEDRLAPAPRMAGEDSNNRSMTGIAKLTAEDGRERAVICLDLSKLLRAEEISALQKASEK